MAEKMTEQDERDFAEVRRAANALEKTLAPGYLFTVIVLRPSSAEGMADGYLGVAMSRSLSVGAAGALLEDARDYLATAAPEIERLQASAKGDDVVIDVADKRETDPTKH